VGTREAESDDRRGGGEQGRSRHERTALSARIRRILGAAAAIGASAGIAAAPPAGAADRQDGGPLTLSRVTIGQHKLQGRITFSVDERMPPLRKLKRYPAAIWAPGRHLCVAIDGRAAKRRLLCVGGQPHRGTVRVGISRFYKRGRAVKVRGFRARLRRRSERSINLRFRLAHAGLGPGRFRFFAAGAWRGNACLPARDGNRDGRAQVADKGKPVCFNRLPERGRLRGRIFEVERVGCTTGRHGAFFNGPTSRKRIALTFDDGPSRYTAAILRSLDRLNAKGTFFELGNETYGEDRVMRRIIERGHEIGNHSLAHAQYPSSTDMARTNQLIRAATGFSPCHFRPPYGAYNSATIAAARRNGMSVALWNVDTQDYMNPGWGTIYSRAVRAGRGSIVLMHDGGGYRGQTAEAVPHIVRTLRRRGYKLVTVTKLMGGRFKLREKR
jgi:peptidoglycan-N-acetylglucosamine deacetylase